MSSTHLPFRVLYSLHDCVETLDFTGPLEILSNAVIPDPTNPSNQELHLFTSTIVSSTQFTTTSQNLVLGRDISFQEAYTKLDEFDILVVPGGGSKPVRDGGLEPIGIVAAFAALPAREGGKTRWLLSVCTGSLFLAEAGVLGGLSATTHYRYYDELRKIGSAKEGEGQDAVQVLEERFVVNLRNEKTGLRIITSGGVSCGMDASLWLINELVGRECMQEAADNVQYAYREGVVIGQNLFKNHPKYTVPSPTGIGIVVSPTIPNSHFR